MHINKNIGEYIATFFFGIVATMIWNFFSNRKLRDRIKKLEDKDSGWLEVNRHSLKVQEKVIDFQDSFHEMNRDIMNIKDAVDNFSKVSKTNSIEIQNIKNEFKKK